ncbi:hypothetical protein B1F79_04800 [Coxiella-like endosymbiont of Rhipicephalus sanguineus]|uniref:hypothetical protein n=1 Tax=Coxiella-like endosymbiont of Rhipicephalus sanguineus TaxID=1955402 RepID=UPI00203FDA25|nr:hypothetical protein [Coxiella-like endosymbiont of Rhipicephalus sanguineus]MBT8506750.1 hypothetical protein [Coxiella-like endosymbiont of Rhipicephalus sanguineus]
MEAIEWPALRAEELEAADLIVNPAGTGIADKRWSKAHKKEIIESRIKLTETLASLLKELGKATPSPLFQCQRCCGYSWIAEIHCLITSAALD